MSNTENESTPADLIDPGDELENEKPAVTREQEAFQSPGFAWKDIALSPLAIDREAAWHLHRHLMGAPALSDIISDSLACTPDALRVLWFCSHAPEDWMTMGGKGAAQRAHRIESRINEWARDHVSGSEIAACVSLFYEILNSAHSTRATPVSEGRSDAAKN